MPTKIPDKLKKAIREMPETDKDKLLLRLVAKDALLVRQLNHRLLEDEVDAEQQPRSPNRPRNTLAPAASLNGTTPPDW